MTSKRVGSSVESKTFSLVKLPASTRPGIDGVAGLVPVAINAFLNRRFTPATAPASIPVKRASPKNTSTPAALNCRIEIDTTDAGLNTAHALHCGREIDTYVGRDASAILLGLAHFGIAARSPDQCNFTARTRH